MNIPGRNHSYTVGVWYALQTSQGRYLCNPQDYLNGNLHPTMRDTRDMNALMYELRASVPQVDGKGTMFDCTEPPERQRGVTIYLTSAWLCASLDELRQVLFAIRPRFKDLRPFERCLTPIMLRISRVPYQQTVLNDGIAPMTALQVVEYRELTSEEVEASKAAYRRRLKQQEEGSLPAQNDPVQRDAEAVNGTTQPREQGNENTPDRKTAEHPCPVDRVVVMFPRPLYQV